MERRGMSGKKEAAPVEFRILTTAEADEAALTERIRTANLLRHVEDHMANAAPRIILSRRAARIWKHIQSAGTVPTYDEMATDLYASRSTISKAMKELRGKGLLPHE